MYTFITHTTWIIFLSFLSILVITWDFNYINNIFSLLSFLPELYKNDTRESVDQNQSSRVKQGWFTFDRHRNTITFLLWSNTATQKHYHFSMEQHTNTETLSLYYGATQNTITLLWRNTETLLLYYGETQKHYHFSMEQHTTTETLSLYYGATRQHKHYHFSMEQHSNKETLSLI